MLREILTTPLGETRSRPWNGIYGPEGRELPAPWIAAEFPELRGETLPPPLDYMCADERIWPIVRERWSRRFSQSFGWRAARLVLIVLTVIGITMLFWPESRMRSASLLTLLAVWAPIGGAVMWVYFRTWSSRAKWRQPRLLLYPTDRHLLHEISMTPIQPRELLLAQWLRAAAPRPARPPDGWRPGGIVPPHWRQGIMKTSFVFILGFLFVGMAARNTGLAARLVIVIGWLGGSWLWLLHKAFAGASLIWIFPIPPMPPHELDRYTLAWWRHRLAEMWHDFTQSVRRMAVSLLIVSPFAGLIFMGMTIVVVTWESAAMFLAVGLIGAGQAALAFSPLTAWGQRYTRWMVRHTLRVFERRAVRLRDRQLALLDANKPLPRPR